MYVKIVDMPPKTKTNLHREEVHQKKDKKFKCGQCPYESYDKDYTRKHEKRVHKQIKDACQIALPT